VLEVPAHTRGAITFVIDGNAFTGDTLFTLGCGRLFEGDPQMMWTSLSKLMTLPDETRVYCGHEYTQSNGRFALTLEPGNAALKARMDEVIASASGGQADRAIHHGAGEKDQSLPAPGFGGDSQVLGHGKGW
jgi:hydroxyacylglutathione hydrolase